MYKHLNNMTTKEIIHKVIKDNKFEGGLVLTYNETLECMQEYAKLKCKDFQANISYELAGFMKANEYPDEMIKLIIEEIESYQLPKFE